MARPKGSVSTASTVVENKVEAVRNEDEKTKENIPVKAEKKENDNPFVMIQNPNSAFKKIRVSVTVYNFDNEGKAYVSKDDAKLFLNLPGYKTV